MKCYCWILVPIIYQNKLSKWKKFIHYQSENNGVPVDAYKLIEETDNHQNLLDLLNNLNIDYEVFRREFVFSKSDYEKAEYFELIIDFNCINEYQYEIKDRCELCNKEVVMIPQSLKIDESKLLKCDLMTYDYSDQRVIISNKLANFIKTSNMKGATLETIYNQKTMESIDNYYRLYIEEVDTYLSKDFKILTEGYCKKCKRYDLSIIKDIIKYQLREIKDYDIFYTKEWFGTGKGSQHKSIIISKKFYNLLLDEEIDKKLWTAEPIITYKN